jgi:phosphoglycerate-specific signal transduction histidine kinase
MPDFVNSKTEHLQKENTELNQRVKELEDVNHRLTNANNDLVVVAQAWREQAILEQNR